MDEFGGFFGGLGGDQDDGVGEGVDVMAGEVGDDFGLTGAAVAAQDGLLDARVEEEALGSVGLEAEELGGEARGS